MFPQHYINLFYKYKLLINKHFLNENKMWGII